MNKKQEHQDIVGLFQQAVPLFTALGDEQRQQIVMQLLQSYELSVNQIASGTPLSRPAISHHLKVLRDAGLVAVRREGTQRFYRIDELAEKYLDLLDELTAAFRVCTNWQSARNNKEK